MYGCFARCLGNEQQHLVDFVADQSEANDVHGVDNDAPLSQSVYSSNKAQGKQKIKVHHNINNSSLLEHLSDESDD